jgi:phenylacetate-CoA ligase
VADLTKPNVLLATPSLVEYLIERLPQMTGKTVKEYGFKSLITTGEIGIGIKEVKEKVEDAYGARWFDWLIPCMEMAGGSCGTRDFEGLHLMGEDSARF